LKTETNMKLCDLISKAEAVFQKNAGSNLKDRFIIGRIIIRMRYVMKLAGMKSKDWHGRVTDPTIKSAVQLLKKKLDMKKWSRHESWYYASARAADMLNLEEQKLLIDVAFQSRNLIFLVADKFPVKEFLADVRSGKAKHPFSGVFPKSDHSAKNRKNADPDYRVRFQITGIEGPDQFIAMLVCILNEARRSGHPWGEIAHKAIDHVKRHVT